MRGAVTSAVALNLIVAVKAIGTQRVRNRQLGPLYSGRLCHDCDSAMQTLFTIGYQQAKPDAVFSELKRAKIDLLVDTRAVAASRRPGFSKRQLAAALDEAGIAYIHLQKLGTPAEGRQAARSGDIDTLWRIYDQHIKTPEVQAALGELLALIKSGKRVCLLCYERDPKQCHRSRIAALVTKHIRVKIDDLIPPLF
jgi:uncharacterized protein (DUF488 family)